MGALDASGPQPQLSHPVTEAAVRILILDCDDRRRGRRAEALLNRGVLVDQAAESLRATTLWKAGAYDLVLVELRGADAGCTTFITSVQGECSRQKFGFYLAQRPYLTPSAEQCRRSLHDQEPHDLMVAGQSEYLAFHQGNRLLVATRRIAAARQLARLQAQTRQFPRAQEVREDVPPAIPASDPVILAHQVLGGTKLQPS